MFSLFKLSLKFRDAPTRDGRFIASLWLDSEAEWSGAGWAKRATGGPEWVPRCSSGFRGGMEGDGQSEYFGDVLHTYSLIP